MSQTGYINYLPSGEKNYKLTSSFRGKSDLHDSSIGYFTFERIYSGDKFSINTIGYYSITVEILIQKMKITEVNIISAHDDMASVDLGNERFCDISKNITEKILAIRLNEPKINIGEVLKHVMPLLIFARKIDNFIRKEMDLLAEELI